MIRDINGLNSAKERGEKALHPDKIKISIGMATCGLAAGAQAVYDEIKSVLEKTKSDIILSKNGCLGFCQAEPIVDVSIPRSPRLTYKLMTPQRAKELLSSLASGEFGKEYLLEDPFFAKQKKIVLRNCGFMDPASIDEYIARDGYYSLYKALNGLSCGAIIDEIKKSGLRGRGGAGFPTGKKWELCKGVVAEKKYIVCNADEGDPGAYMDRSILEGDPHSVLEGMIIGAYAMGASKGFIYVRTEYPLAIVRLKVAIKQAKEYGFIGDDIFGLGFDFDLELREGSGAFVCGEETALINSIEGAPPEPRQRPPYPVEKGLWGYPTVINNVETWANIPVIIQKGWDWFSKIGSEKSKGTKVFSVVGKIKNTGLVEVPMGITLREIIYDIGGGILEGKKFKAVQTGGPSGGCIPESLIDLPVDYERLKEAGSIMGSGGMVVMDEDTCMVDVARFFLGFTSDESCGKCVSCRDGSRALLDILTKICEGKAEESDLFFLEELCEAVQSASLCGLGQTLPNPVISTLKYFRREYQAHIRDKCCPAAVCKELISYYIAPQKCKSCGLCAKNCPVSAISGQKGSAYVIDCAKCTKCGVCLEVCPQNFRAVIKISGKPSTTKVDGKAVCV